MNDYDVQDNLLRLIHRQTPSDDESPTLEGNLQQYLANLISENQHLKQQLNQSKQREQQLIQEKLGLTTEYEQLKDQKNFLGILLQQIADGVMIVSRKGNIHYINEAASRLLGRPVEELQDYYWGCPISNGKTEILLHRPDQTSIIAQLRVAEITWDHHCAYLVSLRDVTEEKQYQAKLEESDLRFRLVADTAPVLIWMTDHQGKLTFVNHEWLHLTGQKAWGKIGSKWLKLIHPDDFAYYWQVYHQAIADQTRFQIQFRLQHPQKGYQWLLSRGVPRLTPEGEFLGFIGSCVDISEHKQLEEELLKVTQAVACSGEAIAILGKNEGLIYQNPAFDGLFGYSREEINHLGGIHCIFSKKDQDKLHQVLATLHHTKNTWYGELTFKRFNGKKQQIHLHVDKITHPDGYLIGLVVMATDISQRKQAEAQLKQANRELKNSVRQLERTNQEIARLSTMVELLQGCFKLEEAYQVLKQQIPQLFAQFSGGIFLQNSENTFLEALIHWGEDFYSEIALSAQDCWGLRRSSLHWSLNPHYLPCPHQHHQPPYEMETLCLPLSARGETLGMLYLSVKKHKKPLLDENRLKFCQMVAENISIALSNLKLREQLKQESIRDPLTHLYNRRYLEASLEQEIARSKRKNQSLSVIMIDIDYFKRINDNFCHAAGDIVLRKLGEFLRQNTRSSDIACRFGGEELTLIFPETSLEQAKNRAEQLREAIKQLTFEFQNQSLGKITASFGLASFPEYGETWQDVLHIADLALYCAKESGRDRVVSAEMILNHLTV
jgi:diguanylate cyclase (GGDEF)-like protein/PAS domain S-box-containing protein